jgi:hypothetical protein
MKMVNELDNIIEEFKKKWDIKGANVWWEEPFKRCFEAGIKQTKSKLREDIEKLRNEPIKFVDKICKDLTLDKVLKSLEDENGK